MLETYNPPAHLANILFQEELPTKTQLLELVDDTVACYSRNPQSIDGFDENGDPICVYRTPDGKACGVGRLVPDDRMSPELEKEAGYDLVFLLGETYGSWAAEKNDVTRAIAGRIDEIQSLHDVESNWKKEGGVSEKGRDTAQLIKAKINELKLV